MRPIKHNPIILFFENTEFYLYKIIPFFLKNPDQKTLFRSKEFKYNSQNGEDGILSFLFSQIGTTNKYAVEFGMGMGDQCNACHLILEKNWHGLLMDGGDKELTQARDFFTRAGKYNEKVKIEKHLITCDNINPILTQYKVPKEIDLLSIDIDGNDYWIWKEIKNISPRVVIIEFNASFGPNRSVTIPYEPDFNVREEHPFGIYHGASIKALTKLAHEKGYYLLCSDTRGVNIVFLRNDLGKDKFSPLAAEKAFYRHSRRKHLGGEDDQWELFNNFPFVEV